LIYFDLNGNVCFAIDIDLKLFCCRNVFKKA
jgi:hypothetical protein